MPPAAPKTWTTRDLLGWMSGAFEERGLDSPRRMAELLLAHVIGCDRLRLYMETDRPAAPLERDTLRGLVRRALDHEPIQYLVGREAFYGLDFRVDRRVLIPRPSTQTLVDEVLRGVRNDPGLAGLLDPADGGLIADVCTGSGCVAVALAQHLPGARVVATDISTDALELAAENVAAHHLGDRIDLQPGDLLDALDAHPAARSAGSLDVLCANPPYIPDHEWPDVEPNVRDHEPESALRAGPDGLEFLRPLIEGSPAKLRPGGLLVLEHAACHAADVLALALGQEHLTDARTVKDVDGLDRVLIARRSR